METSTSHGRRLFRGVGIYVRENGPWSVYVEQRSIYDPAPPWLAEWDGDGIISKAAYAELAALVLRTGVPTVDLNEQVTDLGLPLVFNDHEAIGRMAAEHLLERGFTQFGFIGHPGIYWSEGRRRGFLEAVAKAGGRCDEFCGSGKTLRRYHQRSWEKEMTDVADWLRDMPKPAGIMACNDFRAIQLLDACRRARVAVPEEVAVIGVDDEEIAREVANPPLSSVVPNGLEVGYRAAAMLDALMHGRKPPEREVYVLPTGVVTRRSTDITAISDPKVASSLEFIRRHACEGIDVNDVLRHALISRSVLNQRFQDVMGKTMHAAIVTERLRKVKELLLLETGLSRDQIAERAGFKHPEYLCAAFKQAFGMTMSEFRRDQGHP
jgi:LacI family transcriptional regulator